MYALMEADIVRIDLLAELADDYQCQYIILNKAKNMEGDPESSGLEKIAEVGGYDIFRNGGCADFEKDRYITLMAGDNKRP